MIGAHERLSALQRCCASSGGSLSWLRNPVRYGMFAYACNGVVLLRTPCADLQEVIAIHVGGASLRDLIEDYSSTSGSAAFRLHDVISDEQHRAGQANFSRQALELLPPDAVLHIHSAHDPVYYMAHGFDGLVMPVRMLGDAS